jgi:class 3 adenylate cyclase
MTDPAFSAASLREPLAACMESLASLTDPDQFEAVIQGAFNQLPAEIDTPADTFPSVLAGELFRFIQRQYQGGNGRICLWRFIKRLPPAQLSPDFPARPEEEILDALFRVFLYSHPLDDLTCLFIPVKEPETIPHCMDWIRRYYYHASYPTSLLWLYALDSSLSALFPDEMIYIGDRAEDSPGQIFRPDFNGRENVLLKRYSDAPGHFVALRDKVAEDEFRQIFTFLEREFRDRCLSRSIHRRTRDSEEELREWEKFAGVLKFGVSDRHESGCVSFSDMRSSTEFLNLHGKEFYLNHIQQPFFEQTQLVSRRYRGRIDKFMGDNVMCVFLNRALSGEAERGDAAARHNFFAIVELCRILNALIAQGDITGTRLGLRSGVTYGDQVLRSNLGNDFVRDFTVTGETVNLAARLEHISIHELKLHNQMYFRRTLDRFPEIRQLLSVTPDREGLNAETRRVIRDFTLFQNITSNLDLLERVRFDIRMNTDFYERIRRHLLRGGYALQNPQSAEMHGYERFQGQGFTLSFYALYYNPKGFAGFEKIWILPLDPGLLAALDPERLRQGVFAVTGTKKP